MIDILNTLCYADDIPDEATNQTDSPASFPYEMSKATMNRRANCNTCTDIDHSYQDLETTLYEIPDHMVVPEHVRDTHSTRQHQDTNQDTVYSMAGPDIDSNIAGGADGRGEMHYEMVNTHANRLQIYFVCITCTFFFSGYLQHLLWYSECIKYGSYNTYKTGTESNYLNCIQIVTCTHNYFTGDVFTQRYNTSAISHASI